MVRHRRHGSCDPGHGDRRPAKPERKYAAARKSSKFASRGRHRQRRCALEWRRNRCQSRYLECRPQTHAAETGRPGASVTGFCDGACSTIACRVPHQGQPGAFRTSEVHRARWRKPRSRFEQPHPHRPGDRLSGARLPTNPSTAISPSRCLSTCKGAYCM